MYVVNSFDHCSFAFKIAMSYWTNSECPSFFVSETFQETYLHYLFNQTVDSPAVTGGRTVGFRPNSTRHSWFSTYHTVTRNSSFKILCAIILLLFVPTVFVVFTVAQHVWSTVFSSMLAINNFLLQQTIMKIGHRI